MFHPSLPIGRSLAVEQPFSNKLMEIPQITYDFGVGRLILHRLWRADLIYDAQWGFYHGPIDVLLQYIGVLFLQPR